MKSIILKLTLALAIAGLWFERPAQAQQRQFFVSGRRFGPAWGVNIFSPPIFQLNTDPRGANFGFNQRLLFAPSFRGVISPFGQRSIFRSESSATLSFNPVTGPNAQIVTPAIAGFSVDAFTGLQSFFRPSMIVQSNLNTMFTSLNPVTPTFLAGNFNFAIPLNRTVPLSSTGTLMTGTSLSGSQALSSLLGTSGSALQFPVSGGTSADQFLVLAAAGNSALATGGGADSSMSMLATTLIALTHPEVPRGAKPDTRTLPQKFTDYHGYVPANFILP